MNNEVQTKVILIVYKKLKIDNSLSAKNHNFFDGWNKKIYVVFVTWVFNFNNNSNQRKLFFWNSNQNEKYLTQWLILNSEV